MAWPDALLAGGFALAGVGLQQGITWRGDARRRQADRAGRLRDEQHRALVDLIKSGRRVQRALVDCHDSHGSDEAIAAFRREMDRLTEAVAVVRLVIVDVEVVGASERFEEAAKEIERTDAWGDASPQLRLTPLIKVAQRYEGRGDLGP